jgi:hypothetical protein
MRSGVSPERDKVLMAEQKQSVEDNRLSERNGENSMN